MDTDGESRRWSELNGSLSGSARITLLLTLYGQRSLFTAHLCMNTPRNCCKIAFVIVAIGALCIIAYMGLRLFDQSVTLDRQR
jgi:hypothetical protein